MKIKTNLNETERLFNNAERIAQQLAREGYEVFVKETPIRTGRARRSTRLDQTTIVADYPYAERLDQGYSSQNRRGMVEPTKEFLERRIDSITRTIK